MYQVPQTLNTGMEISACDDEDCQDCKDDFTMCNRCADGFFASVLGDCSRKLF